MPEEKHEVDKAKLIEFYDALTEEKKEKFMNLIETLKMVLIKDDD